MSAKGVNKLDLTGQYVGAILIPQYNRALEIRRSNGPYSGLVALMDLANVLDFSGEKGQKMVEKRTRWNSIIVKINRISSKYTAIDESAKNGLRYTVRDSLAAKIVDEISTEIHDYIMGQGYFTMEIQSGNFYNPSYGRVSGEKKPTAGFSQTIKRG